MRKLALTALYLAVLAVAGCAQGVERGNTDPAGPAYNSGDKGGDGGGGGGGSM